MVWILLLTFAFFRTLQPLMTRCCGLPVSLLKRNGSNVFFLFLYLYLLCRASLARVSVTFYSAFLYMWQSDLWFKFLKSNVFDFAARMRILFSTFSNRWQFIASRLCWFTKRPGFTSFWQKELELKFTRFSRVLCVLISL